MLEDFDVTVYTEFLKDYLVAKGMISFWAGSINLVVIVMILGLTVFFMDFILRKVIIGSFKLFSEKTNTTLGTLSTFFPLILIHFQSCGSACIFG